MSFFRIWTWTKSGHRKLKSPYTTGRKGQARVAAELVRFVHISSSFCNYTILFWCKATLILGGFIQVLEVFFGGVGLLLDTLFLSWCLLLVTSGLVTLTVYLYIAPFKKKKKEKKSCLYCVLLFSINKVTISKEKKEEKKTQAYCSVS